jgi:hypothetical protein
MRIAGARICVGSVVAACSLHAQPDGRSHLGVMASLPGHYTAAVESRARPSAPWVSSTVRSQLYGLLGNSFLAESLRITVPGGQSIALLGILGFDRVRGVYRFVWLDNVYQLMDVHEGQWVADTLSVDNLRSGTTLRVGTREQHSRMRWHSIDEDGFVAESWVSADSGRSWWMQQRGRYRRSDR